MPHDPVTRQDVLDEVSKLKDSIDRWRVQTETKVNKHDAALFGNGQPGMDEQIRSLIASMSILVRLGWLVTGSFVTLAVSGLMYAIVYLIRNTP